MNEKKMYLKGKEFTPRCPHGFTGDGCPKCQELPQSEGDAYKTCPRCQYTMELEPRHGVYMCLRKACGYIDRTEPHQQAEAPSLKEVKDKIQKERGQAARELYQQMFDKPAGELAECPSRSNCGLHAPRCRPGCEIRVALEAQLAHDKTRMVKLPTELWVAERLHSARFEWKSKWRDYKNRENVGGNLYGFMAKELLKLLREQKP